MEKIFMLNWCKNPGPTNVLRVTTWIGMEIDEFNECSVNPKGD